MNLREIIYLLSLLNLFACCKNPRGAMTTIYPGFLIQASWVRV